MLSSWAGNTIAAAIRREARFAADALGTRGQRERRGGTFGAVGCVVMALGIGKIQIAEELALWAELALQ